MSQSVTPADSGSLTRFVPIRCDCLGFGRVATDYVGVFPFCRPLHACVRKRFLADFYRYRKMKSGQLTDVQRPSFGFRFSFGGSRGFSGSEETQLISDTIITHDLGPKGATLPESAGHTHLIGREFSGDSQLSNPFVYVWQRYRFWRFSLCEVTTKPQYLTSQSSLGAFRLLMTQLAYSRRHARQPTGCEECTRSVRHVFVGGRCGGAAPAQGRAEGPTAQKCNNEGRKNTFAPLVQICESVAAE